MGQEPQKFAIIGSGRLALHIAKYLHYYTCELYFWCRSNQPDIRLKKLAHQVEYLNQLPKDAIRLVLISDQSLVQFIHENQTILAQNKIVHFSGSIDHCQFELKLSAFHPLFTFTNQLYTKKEYEKITFVQEEYSQEFTEIFPFLKNPVFEISSHQKLRYHALVCCICNFNSAIIQLAHQQMQDMDLKIPIQSFEHIAKQTVINGFESPKTCLTGPIARNDQTLIKKQLNELNGSGLDLIYRSILEALKDKK
ncbi:DUF2520 domain-containing protein [bacterium]|nr:DUF2520 domain-containing protein [bacterium]